VLPDKVPAGKRLQCPDCRAAFSPRPGAERSTSPRRSAGYDEDELPPRRGNKRGSVTIFVAIGVIALIAMGGVGVVIWIYLDDKRSREEAVAHADQANIPDPEKMVALAGMPAGGMAGGLPGGLGGAAPAQPVRLKPGDRAPEIEGGDLGGKPMKLSDFRGKVVVLDFWNDWNPFCQGAYTYKNHLINRMKGEPFVLIGVNTDGSIEQARQLLKKRNISWRSWYDGIGVRIGPIFTRYGVTTVPATFVIDKEGIIRSAMYDVPGEEILDQAVDEVMAQGEPRPANAPVRWRPSSTGFSQLGEEVEIGRYRLRPPADYTAEKVTPEPAQQTFRWKGPQRPDGTVPVLEVRLSPAQPMGNKLEDILEKELQAIPSTRLGWSCVGATRGEVNGMVMARARWFISESLNAPKYKKSGTLYSAVDGDTLIRISDQDSMFNFNNGPDAAPLTLRKAK